MTSLQLLRDAHGDFRGKLQSVSLALLTQLRLLIAAFPIRILVPERPAWSQNSPSPGGHSLLNALSDVTGRGHTGPAVTSHTGCSVL